MSLRGAIRHRFARLLLVALLGIMPIIRLALAGPGGQLAAGRVYSLAAVRAGLAREPAAWMNGPVLIRALASGCTAWVGSPGASPCLDATPELVDVGSASTSTPLPLAYGSPAPWLTFLRHLPLLGQLAPPPQSVSWGIATTYRVQLRRMPGASHEAADSYEALLLDAAP